MEIAKEDHIVLLFAEYATYLFDMLRVIVSRDTQDMFHRKVFETCVEYLESLRRLNKRVVSLSEREIQILSLTADGYKREEIAAQLYVSSGTVQVHLHNIYTKLEVNGKVAAIKKAQILKLI